MERIAVITSMKKLPSCCKKCVYYDPCMFSAYQRVTNKNNGACKAMGGFYSTESIIVSRDRLKNCPLKTIEMEANNA